MRELLFRRQKAPEQWPASRQEISAADSHGRTRLGAAQPPPNRREILREHRAAREPRSDPAAVGLARRQRRQRAAAAAPRVDIGATPARRRDRDRSRTGCRPNRRDHHRRNRTSPCCPVLPRRRVRPGGRLLLASQIGRRTRAKVISVDYRLAPEHPYPAAVDDALAAYQALLHNGTAPSDIAVAGESAGGGLAVATLVNARDHGLPLPAAAFVMSPYADLTLAGATMDTKREADPLLSRENLQPRVPDYTSGHDAALGLISPIFADLSGLPPLIIQAGTHEVLLDNAVRLARQAATADVEVTLDITPRVMHVFQGLLPDPRRSGRRTGQSRTAPISASRQRRTRHRIEKGRTPGMTDLRTNPGRLGGSTGAHYPNEPIAPPF